MKPCKIRVYLYYRPMGEPDDIWSHGYRCQPPEGEYALLCDSEEHADRVLAGLERVAALEDEVALLEGKLRDAQTRIAAMV